MKKKQFLFLSGILSHAVAAVWYLNQSERVIVQLNAFLWALLATGLIIAAVFAKDDK